MGVLPFGTARRSARTPRVRRWLPAVLLLALASAPGTLPTRAQVSISPTSVFLGGASRFEELLVFNGTDETREVTVEFTFGYPAGDSLGRTILAYGDSAAAARYSMAGWIRGFPRRFVLAPGQRQVLRLTATPPAHLPDGMYWCRIRIASGVQGPLAGFESPDAVAVRVDTRFEQVISGFYRKGDVASGLRVAGLTAGADSSDVRVLAHLERLGNAPFLGSVHVQIRDAGGAVVAEHRTTASVYFDGARAWALPRGGLAPGRYTASLRFEARRDDMPPDRLPPAGPAAASVDFVLQ